MVVQRFRHIRKALHFSHLGPFCVSLPVRVSSYLDLFTATVLALMDLPMV